LPVSGRVVPTGSSAAGGDYVPAVRVRGWMIQQGDPPCRCKWESVAKWECCIKYSWKFVSLPDERVNMHLKGVYLLN